MGRDKEQENWNDGWSAKLFSVVFQLAAFNNNIQCFITGFVVISPTVDPHILYIYIYVYMHMKY
jgi:hypothetical protein